MGSGKEKKSCFMQIAWMTCSKYKVPVTHLVATRHEYENEGDWDLTGRARESFDDNRPHKTTGQIPLLSIQKKSNLHFGAGRAGLLVVSRASAISLAAGRSKQDLEPLSFHTDFE